jgi:hypothetical protein
MRVILIALMVATPAVAAQAQTPFQRQQRDPQMRNDSQSRPEQTLSPEMRRKKAREEESAAKSALDRLPDKPFDPWQKVR